MLRPSTASSDPLVPPPLRYCSLIAPSRPRPFSCSPQRPTHQPARRRSIHSLSARAPRIRAPHPLLCRPPSGPRRARDCSFRWQRQGSRRPRLPPPPPASRVGYTRRETAVSSRAGGARGCCLQCPLASMERFYNMFCPSRLRVGLQRALLGPGEYVIARRRAAAAAAGRRNLKDAPARVRQRRGACPRLLRPCRGQRA